MSQLISKVLSKASHDLMGNFDFSLLNFSHHNTDFIDFITLNCRYPLVSVPTRIIGQGTTIIGNIFVYSSDLKLCYADVVAFPGSDHFIFHHLILVSAMKY